MVQPINTHYISQGFNLSATVGTATSANLVTVSDVVPQQWIRCSKEPILIVFLNSWSLGNVYKSRQSNG
jgi:hypothetical protein